MLVNKQNVKKCARPWHFCTNHKKFFYIFAQWQKHHQRSAHLTGNKDVPSYTRDASLRIAEENDPAGTVHEEGVIN